MAEIYEIDSEKFTQVEPTGEEEIQIGANKKATLQAIADLHKDPTYEGLTLYSPVDGFEPIPTGGTQVESSFSLLQALQMLYRIGGNGSIKVVGNGLNKFGLVSIGDTTLAGILFNTSNNTVYIRDTTTVANSKQVTDLEIMNWLTEGTSIVLGSTSTQEVNLADIKMTDFTKLNTTPSSLPGLDIQITDSLLSVIQNLFSGITDNGKIKFVCDGYEEFGVVIIDANLKRYHLVAMNAYTCEVYLTSGDDISDITNKTDSEILRILVKHATIIDLSRILISAQMKYYSTVNTSSINLSGNNSKFYVGTNLTPTVTINNAGFDGTKPEAVLVCGNAITPRFVTSNSSEGLYLHTELSKLPTSGNGTKVYTVYCQRLNDRNLFFVNGASYMT